MCTYTWIISLRFTLKQLKLSQKKRAKEFSCYENTLHVMRVVNF